MQRLRERVELSPIHRLGLFVFGSVFVVSSFLSGYFLTQIYLVAQASSDWPHVEGVIDWAQVNSSGFNEYRADVSYSYVVDGRTYAGTMVRASDGTQQDPKWVERLISGLEPGQTVKVFYDPQKPSRALLQPGAGFQEYALLIVPVLMLAIGIGLHIFLYVQTRPKLPMQKPMESVDLTDLHVDPS